MGDVSTLEPSILFPLLLYEYLRYCSKSIRLLCELNSLRQ